MGEQLGVREEFCRVGRRWAESHVELVGMAVRLYESGEWALDGAVTCAHWIADVLGIEVGTAREWIRVGYRLAELPLIRKRFAAGELLFTQVRALTRDATAANEGELIGLVAGVRAGELRLVWAAWAARHEDDEQRDRRQRQERCLWWTVEPDGMVRAQVMLPPDQFAFFSAVIDAEVVSIAREPAADSGIPVTGSRGSHRGRSRRRSPAQLRPDALVRIAADQDPRRREPPDQRFRSSPPPHGPPTRTGQRTRPGLRGLRLFGVPRIPPRNPPHEQSGRTLFEETELRCSRCHPRKRGRPLEAHRGSAPCRAGGRTVGPWAAS